MKYRFALLIVLACICSVLAEASETPIRSFGWDGINVNVP